MSSEPFDEPTGLGDRLDDALLQLEAWLARGRPLVVGVAVVAAMGGLVWWLARPPGPERPIDDLLPLAQPVGPSSTTVEAGSGSGSGPGAGSGSGSDSGSGPAQAGGPEVEPEDDRPVVVHVIGAVRHPGLVTLAAGDRISDAVQAAGGSTPEADLDRLNLAAPLVDGMQVRVPETGESAPGDGGADGGPPLIRLPEPGPGASGGADEPATRIVDLNRATEPELQSLPGIGPALAQAIVEWRSEHGPFVTVDDLEAVPGIGPAKLAGLRERVRV